jgi:hypothetical protein
MKRGKIELVDGIYDVPCPCGGKVHAGFTAEGEGMAFHSMPACRKFIELEPDEFLKWRRETAEQTIGEVH